MITVVQGWSDGGFALRSWQWRQREVDGISIYSRGDVDKLSKVIVGAGKKEKNQEKL